MAPTLAPLPSFEARLAQAAAPNDIRRLTQNDDTNPAIRSLVNPFAASDGRRTAQHMGVMALSTKCIVFVENEQAATLRF